MDTNSETSNPSNQNGQQPSSVAQMFQNRSVFITGASGFIGRVLLEKLLRSYQGIKRVYILMRPKKNQNPYDRLHKQLLQVPIFDAIRSMDSKELLDKIVIVAGDIAEPRLGISDEDMAMMLADESLSIVFHSAATIKFDEPIRQSIRLNLMATNEMINFCKKLPNLICLCHVSTAYVNSDIKDNSGIEEKLYPINYKPQDMIKLAELMDENLMQGLKVQLVGQRPNTYTYTKALAEHLIATEAADLPVIIIRPSIVTGAWKEPLPGWVDNLNGPTGLILAIGKGLLRSLLAFRSVKADIIPVDVVVNTMIASTYYTAKLYKKIDSLEKTIETKQEVAAKEKTDTSKAFTDFDLSKLGSFHSPIAGPNGTHANHNTTSELKPPPLTKLNGNNAPAAEKADDRQTSGDYTTSGDRKLPHIVHCTSADINPLSWGEVEDMFPLIRKYPSAQVLRYPFGTFKSNYYVDLAARVFAHYLPALIIDMICGLLGKKRQLLSVYNKLHGATAALTHFCTHNYNFKARNFKLLEAELSDSDKKDLFMDITNLNWWNYFETYILGARRFVLKEPDENLPEARRSFKRAYYIEISFRVALVAIACALLMPFVAQPIQEAYRSILVRA